MDTDHIPIDLEVLVREIVDYLAVVDALRSVGYEPTWRREPHSRPFRSVLPVVDAAITVRRSPPPRFTV